MGSSARCYLIPRPGHAEQTTNAERGQLLEGRGREVERRLGTASAAIGDGDSDRLALVVGGELSATDRVVVRVAASVTRVSVKEEF